MKNKWRILKILVTVILLGFLLSFSLKRFSNKPLENIAVNLKQTPVYFIDEKDIRDIVKKENPGGRVGDVNIPSLEKKINALPAVDSANVYLNLNGSLNLDIRQRVPVFRLSKNGRDFYVDAKGTEFPISKNYSHPCMLVTGNVQKEEYVKLAELVRKIDQDDFSRKYFIGISKDGGSYNLLTSDGNYKVEIGDLDNIVFKVKGFKTFVEKYLVYQDPRKYSKVSVRFDNQIVTTLNPNYSENDSMITDAKKKMENAPVMARKKALAEAAIANKATVKPIAKKTEKKTEKKPAKPAPKPVEKTKPQAEKKKQPETKNPKPAAPKKTLEKTKKTPKKKPEAKKETKKTDKKK